jgi:Flp pilus assembly protein TadG
MVFARPGPEGQDPPRETRSVNASRVKQFLSFWRPRDESGSAAIEFAFVAPVFFVLLFGIIEGGIMFFGQAALINATQDAARLIRTGQAQGDLGLDQGAFKQKVCDGISALFKDCSTNLLVDVQAYPAGFGGNLPSPLDGGDPQAGFGTNYNAGGPCDVVIVRALYKYNVITPIVSPLLTGGKGYKYLLAAAAIRNEPYTAAVQGC